MVKAAPGPHPRSKRNGEPLQVPSEPAITSPEAGALEKRRSFRKLPHCFGFMGPSCCLSLKSVPAKVFLDWP